MVRKNVRCIVYWYICCLTCWMFLLKGYYPIVRTYKKTIYPSDIVCTYKNFWLYSFTNFRLLLRSTRGLVRSSTNLLVWKYNIEKKVSEIKWICSIARRSAPPKICIKYRKHWKDYGEFSTIWTDGAVLGVTENYRVVLLSFCGHIQMEVKTKTI